MHLCCTSRKTNNLAPLITVPPPLLLCRRKTRHCASTTVPPTTSTTDEPNLLLLLLRLFQLSFSVSRKKRCYCVYSISKPILFSGSTSAATSLLSNSASLEPLALITLFFRQYLLQNTFIQRCMHGLYLYLVRVISSLPLYYLKCSYPPGSTTTSHATTPSYLHKCVQHRRIQRGGPPLYRPTSSGLLRAAKTQLAKKPPIREGTSFESPVEFKQRCLPSENRPTPNANC